ncbi:hypothetical protein CL658_05760 [bacterium]|nr:hypothetical protein [bacterium]
MINAYVCLFVLILSPYLIAEKTVESWQSLKFKGTVQQKEDYTCGLASLATLINLYNGKVTEGELIDIIGKNKITEQDIKKLSTKIDMKHFVEDNTITLLDLSMAATYYNFSSTGIKAPFNTLKNLKVPVIIHLKTKKLDHFSVLVGYSDAYIQLLDPSWGNITLTHSKFKKMYTGNILVLNPNSKQYTTISLKKIKKNFNVTFFNI